MSAILEDIPPCEGRGEGDKSLHITGDLAAADAPLVSTGDVTIDGRVCPRAQIRAAGSVRISGDAQSAQIICGGELNIAAGAIVGGKVSAYRGITCRAVGHRVKSPTELIIGIDEQDLDVIQQRVAEIDHTLGKAQAIRTQLDRLSHTQLNLTAAQKEQMTELLFSAASAEKRASAAIERLKIRLGPESREHAVCIVNEMIFAGVTIVFPGARAMIETAFKGPLKLISVQTAKSVVIQMIELPSGKVHPLHAVPHTGRTEELMAELERVEKSLCR